MCIIYLTIILLIDAYLELVESDWLKDIDARIIYALMVGEQHGFIKPKDVVVVVTGWKRGSGHTNTLRLVSVPEILDDAAFAQYQ